MEESKLVESVVASSISPFFDNLLFMILIQDAWYQSCVISLIIWGFSYTLSSMDRLIICDVLCFAALPDAIESKTQ
ncbi:unnamed protein product [Linum tenue]|uniref:Uncharacterized protein n=1 Tax=Linum tenue TaxID=586396 RepID=A0AAV0H5G8_9ROSI|nr:unnamed protein product [Linum tenue]